MAVLPLAGYARMHFRIHELQSYELMIPHRSTWR